MGSFVAVLTTTIKLGAVFGLLVAGVGIGGYVGVCSVSDDVPCELGGTSAPSSTEDPSVPAGESQRPDAGESDRTEGGEPAAEEPPQDEDGSTSDDDTVEESDATPDEQHVSGPEPPEYPDRTNRTWDRELEFGGDPGATVAGGDTWEVHSEDVERFLAVDVNEYRVENGLDRLEYSHALASVSREHSADMFRRDYFAHENPDGERAWDRWGSDHCRSWYGENLFRTWANASLQGEPEPLRTADDLAFQTLEGWQDSPPHDEAMRADAWDVVGYGVYFGESPEGERGHEMYVTMNMCTYNENPGP